MAESLIEESITAFRDGEKARAYQLLKAAIEQDPENINAFGFIQSNNVLIAD